MFLSKTVLSVSVCEWLCESLWACVCVCVWQVCGWVTRVMSGEMGGNGKWVTRGHWGIGEWWPLPRFPFGTFTRYTMWLSIDDHRLTCFFLSNSFISNSFISNTFICNTSICNTFYMQHQPDIGLFWNTSLGKYWELNSKTFAKWLHLSQIAFFWIALPFFRYIKANFL